MGFYDSPKESEKIAESVSSTAGVVFIPALCGFGAPINDPTASAGFLGPVFNYFIQPFDFKLILSGKV